MRRKVTVIRRPFFPDISVMSYGKEIGPCDFYHNGQEFVVDENSYIACRISATCVIG